MVARDNTFQLFDLKDAKFEQMSEKWAERLQQYYKLNM